MFLGVLSSSCSVKIIPSECVHPVFLVCSKFCFVTKSTRIWPTWNTTSSRSRMVDLMRTGSHWKCGLYRKRTVGSGHSLSSSLMASRNHWYVSQSQPFVITWNFACKFICNIWQVLNCGSVQTSLTPFESSLILTPWNQEFSDEDLDSDDLRPLLASLKFFKAKYTHKANAAAFCYEALRVPAFLF